MLEPRSVGQGAFLYSDALFENPHILARFEDTQLENCCKRKKESSGACGAKLESDTRTFWVLKERRGGGGGLAQGLGI